MRAMGELEINLTMFGNALLKEGTNFFIDLPRDSDISSVRIYPVSEHRGMLSNIKTKYWSTFQKLSGYSLATLINGLTNFALIPVIIHAVGAHGWVSIATGQAAGMIAGVVISLGWGVTGPASVAVLAGNDRAAYYAATLVARVILLIPAVFALSAVILAVPIEDRLSGVLVGVGTALYGLGATWFFVGTSQPMMLLRYDTAPRVVCVAVGAIILVTGLPLWAFAVSQLVGAFWSVFLPALAILRKSDLKVRRLLTRRSIRGSLQGQGSAFLVGVNSLYLLTPLVIVTACAPAWGPQFALSDRIMKMILNALLPVQQVLQGWVPVAPNGYLRGRVVKAVGNASLLAAVATVTTALLAPFVSRILGANLISIGLNLSIPVGLIIGLSTVTQCTGATCLVPLGRVRQVGFSALAGTLVGLPLLLIFTMLWGGPGAAWAIVLAEATVFFYQAFVLRRELRKLEAYPSSPQKDIKPEPAQEPNSY